MQFSHLLMAPPHAVQHAALPLPPGGIPAPGAAGGRVTQPAAPVPQVRRRRGLCCALLLTTHNCNARPPCAWLPRATTAPNHLPCSTFPAGVTASWRRRCSCAALPATAHTCGMRPVAAGCSRRRPTPASLRQQMLPVAPQPPTRCLPTWSSRRCQMRRRRPSAAGEAGLRRGCWAAGSSHTALCCPSQPSCSCLAAAKGGQLDEARPRRRGCKVRVPAGGARLHWWLLTRAALQPAL